MADDRRKTHHSGPQTWDRGYGYRQDGTPKGRGYLGLLKRPDGGLMTEYTIGVPINGTEMEIPSIVPTLTKDQINHLLLMEDGDRIPNAIVRQAIDHARGRISAGLSPFYD